MVLRYASASSRERVLLRVESCGQQVELLLTPSETRVLSYLAHGYANGTVSTQSEESHDDNSSRT